MVGVLPKSVGTTQLLIHEPLGWLPAYDACLPAQRDSEYPEPVVNQGSFLHQDRLRCDDIEVELWWGDMLQVGGIGEKANTRSRPSVTLIDVVRKWSAPRLIVVGGSKLARCPTSAIGQMPARRSGQCLGCSPA
jgi:hypothetical protein